ncbi:tRNA pseudouridine(55) synthase TruB [bacterium]|nr:tRNA pseudouridine(55) synthase TruB [bacterium]
MPLIYHIFGSISRNFHKKVYNWGMILNLYKPYNITSFNFIHKAKKILEVEKIGHAGTLDPLATGVMVVLTDQDTKKQAEYTKKDKTYIAEILLGASSPSIDFETKVSFSSNPPSFKTQDILQVCYEMKGVFSIPAPSYSAKLVSGSRLYEYAHSGIEAPIIPEVTSEIYECKLLKVLNFWNAGKMYPIIEVEISCSSGTYIRSVAKLIAKKLGTEGVLYYLLRTQVGDFSLLDSINILEN